MFNSGHPSRIIHHPWNTFWAYSHLETGRLYSPSPWRYQTNPHPSWSKRFTSNCSVSPSWYPFQRIPTCCYWHCPYNSSCWKRTTHFLPKFQFLSLWSQSTHNLKSSDPASGRWIGCIIKDGNASPLVGILTSEQCSWSANSTYISWGFNDLSWYIVCTNYRTNPQTDPKTRSAQAHATWMTF